MASVAKETQSLYLRYSDDILLVCKPEHQIAMSSTLEQSMTDARLELHDGLGKRSVCILTQLEDGLLSCDPPLQYLGFSFDGRTIRIRSQTIARFLRRMRKAVRLEKHLAKARAQAGGVSRVRKKKLYARFTHLGRSNFITRYATDARRIIKKNGIREQLKPHWRELHAALEVDE